MEAELFKHLNEVFNKEYIIKKKNIDKECKHANVVKDKGTIICTDCGYQKKDHVNMSKDWRYYGNNDTRHSSDPNRCHIRKYEYKTIQKDVTNMGFNDKIISIANQLYEKVTDGKIYRGNSRKSIIFACIFHAYVKMGNPQEFNKLLKIFNLQRKIGLKGFKRVSLICDTSQEVEKKYITIESIIKNILIKLNAESHYFNQIYAIYKTIKNKSSVLNRSRPHSLASGLIYYYILISNKNMSLKYYSKKVQLSELTINRIVKEIAKLLNTKHLIK